jgi:hypothetical protein
MMNLDIHCGTMDDDLMLAEERNITPKEQNAEHELLMDGIACHDMLSLSAETEYMMVDPSNSHIANGWGELVGAEPAIVHLNDDEEDLIVDYEDTLEDIDAEDTLNGFRDASTTDQPSPVTISQPSSRSLLPTQMQMDLFTRWKECVQSLIPHYMTYLTSTTSKPATAMILDDIDNTCHNECTKRQDKVQCYFLECKLCLLHLILFPIEIYLN